MTMSMKIFLALKKSIKILLQQWLVFQKIAPQLEKRNYNYKLITEKP